MILFYVTEEQALNILDHYNVIVNSEDEMELKVCVLLNKMIDEVCHAD